MDLMIGLDAPSSRKNKFLTLRTFYTRQNLVNKEGKYKGSAIHKIDVQNCFPVSNCDIAKVRELFKKHCLQISENEFCIDFADFKPLFDSFPKSPVFFIFTSANKILLINSVEFLKGGFSGRKPKEIYSVGSRTVLYQKTALDIEESDFKNQNEISIKQINPKVRLHYDAPSKIYSLFFDYGGTESPFLSKESSVVSENTVYLKNFQFEKSAAESLLKSRFTKLSQNRFVYSGGDRANLKEKLLRIGISLESDSDVVVPEIKVSKNSSGWFDIDLTCRIDGKLVDLASKMDLFASGSDAEIDGKRVVLPDSVLGAKNDFVLENGRLKINQKSTFSLLGIIHEAGKSAADFFPYKETKLCLPDKNQKAAFPYQLEGIKWLKFLFLNHFGGCLADDMGLGKTFQMISFLEDAEIRAQIKKVLVVVPKSLLSNWKKEFEKFSSNYKVEIYHGESRKNFSFDNFDVALTTYNTASLDAEKLCEQNFSLVVFDEIQTIKNFKGEISSSMKKIKSAVKFGLSGTPMENSISELWNVMDTLNPGILSSHASFMRRFSNQDYEELKSILNFFIMRRMKKDVLKELPQKSEQIIYCDMDEKQRALYNGINLKVKAEIMSLKAFAAPVILKGLTLLRECCDDPELLDSSVNVEKIADSCKLDALDILLESLFKSGHKVLLFSNYVSMLQIIKTDLEKKDEYKDFVFYLDGQTKDRSEVVADFENSPKGIFLISIKAGGVGLNLTSAQDVIIFDPWWNPFVEHQAVDRTHRIGQKNPVTVYKLVAADTLEEKIIAMQNEKEAAFDDLINGISQDKNLSIEKVLKLL